MFYKVLFRFLIVFGLFSGPSQAVDCFKFLTKLINKFSRPTTVIVDAFSTGNMIAPRLNAIGHRVIHVRSSSNRFRPYELSFREKDFNPEDLLEFDGDFEGFTQQLKLKNVTSVIAGAESGVNFADQLANVLTPHQANSIKLSKARRDKFEAAKVLKSKGIRAIEQVQATSIDDIRRFFHKTRFNKYVIKPASSAGADQVYFCETLRCLEERFKQVFKSVDIFGQVNDVVLAQEFIGAGDLSNEYVVNFVSKNGVHQLASLWHYVKRPSESGSLYYYDELLSAEGSLEDDLIEYGLSVLDALEVREGPSHLEVLVDEKGPVLVDAGFRLAGGSFPRVEALAIGRNQADLLEQSKHHLKTWKALKSYPMNKTLKIFEIANLKTQKYLRPDLEDFLKNNLESFNQLILAYAIDEKLPVSIDLASMIGEIILVHKNNKIVENDLQTLIKWEKQGILFK